MENNVYFCSMVQNQNIQSQNTSAGQMTDQDKLGIIHHLQTILLSTHLPQTLDENVAESSTKPAEELDTRCINDEHPWIQNPSENTQKTQNTISKSNNDSKIKEKENDQVQSQGQGGNQSVKKLKNNKGKAQSDSLGKMQQDIDKRYMERILWKKNVDGVEPLYRLKTLIFRKHKYQKEQAQRMIGPGTYDPLYYYKKSDARRQSQTKGQMKSCTPRLVLDTIGECESFPNPNKYYESWAKFQAANDRRKHPGKIPLFQSTPCMKSRPTHANLAQLGPGLYNIKSPLEEFIKKKTSKRGPYDLFTPSRDISPKVPYDFYGFYEIAEIGLGNVCKNSGDDQKGRLLINSRNRRITGERISYESTLWPKNNNLPGPGHYFINYNQCKGKSESQKHTPFGTGSKARPSTQKGDGALERSPNRYEIVQKVDIIGHGHKSAFKSSIAGKRLDLKKLALLQARLEPTKRDLPPAQIQDLNSCCC